MILDRHDHKARLQEPVRVDDQVAGQQSRQPGPQVAAATIHRPVLGIDPSSGYREDDPAPPGMADIQCVLHLRRMTLVEIHDGFGRASTRYLVTCRSCDAERTMAQARLAKANARLMQYDTWTAHLQDQLAALCPDMRQRPLMSQDPLTGQIMLTDPIALMNAGTERPPRTGPYGS